VVSISTATRAVVDSVAIPGGPWGIAFRTSGVDTLMYVSSRDGGAVTEVDARTMTKLRTFNVGGRPHGLVISPDGSTLYAADNGQGRVIAISVSTGLVTNSVALPGAFGIAISPDGSTLFVTTDGSRGAVITASSLAVTQLYETGGNGRQVVAAPDGASAWDANEGGWVDIIRR
jgi:DNA-binding beta-propeller fold protein YncE